MKIEIFVASIFCLVSSSLASPIETILEEWKTWKLQHGKHYSSHHFRKIGNEETKRIKIWMDNTAMIEKHNQEYLMGQHTHTLKMNKFGDLTNAEFTSMMNGFRSTGAPRTGARYMVHSASALPASVDWRQAGAVTPVKDQGQCGACWAFSVTGALEGQWQLNHGELVSLSEQDLMDCIYGNKACEGGDPERAFKYLESSDGIDTEESYPYTARDGTSCKFQTSSVGATEYDMTIVKAGDEGELQSAVANLGPVSVCVDASQGFQFYNSGVYNDPKCSSTALDHAVLVVGYGTDPDTKQDYWLVKNSWNTNWGEQGYIRMRRNDNNMCGIATHASVPLV